MNYTLWRGGVLLGRADLEPSGHSHVLRGPIQHTPELYQLGPIAQDSFPNGAVIQHFLPRPSEWSEASGGDLDVVEIYESSGEHDRQNRITSQVTPEQLLTLRSADGQVVAARMLSVWAPPMLPKEVTAMLDTASLEHLQRWRLICHLAG